MLYNVEIVQAVQRSVFIAGASSNEHRSGITHAVRGRPSHSRSGKCLYFNAGLEKVVATALHADLAAITLLSGKFASQSP